MYHDSEFSNCLFVGYSSLFNISTMIILKCIFDYFFHQYVELFKYTIVMTIEPKFRFHFLPRVYSKQPLYLRFAYALSFSGLTLCDYIECAVWSFDMGNILVPLMISTFMSSYMHLYGQSFTCMDLKSLLSFLSLLYIGSLLGTP